MLKFLGSAYFALILIAISALAVIAGTLLESRTSSHGVADQWIYSHPLFHLLLLGYFINILFSALSRWPFKPKHVPFLITHLGLLMVISGVFVKSVWGTQGQMVLIEGTASNQLTLPQQPALLVERKDKIYSLPIKNRQLPQNNLGIKLVDWQPHAQENFVSWNKPDEILGLPQMPVLIRESISHEQARQEAQNLNAPFLLIHQDKNQTNLLSKDVSGQIIQKTFPHDHLESWIAYDHGFQGYTMHAEIPLATNESIALHESSLKEQLRQHQEIFSPPLELIKQAAEHSKLDFADTTVDYLKQWHRQKEWLFKEQGPAWLDDISWETLPKQDYSALYWIAALWEKDLLKHLKIRGWPLLEPLESLASPEEVYMSWMYQLYQVRAQIPSPPTNIDREIANGMLSAYMRLYNIHYQNLPSTEKIITLETPLYRQIHPAEPPQKIEEARPYILVQVEDDTVPLVYDPKATGLKWPTSDAKTLLRFQPHRTPLPYIVRLHRALDIKYPGSDQTLSYECSLSLQDKEGLVTPCSLRMNNVYETAEGFRFYLAGMGTIDSLGVRSAQIVVNRDPAKYWLTYPGGLLIALGIVLLFWVKKPV